MTVLALEYSCASETAGTQASKRLLLVRSENSGFPHRFLGNALFDLSASAFTVDTDAGRLARPRFRPVSGIEPSSKGLPLPKDILRP